ncbi:MAG: acetyl-CoA carboxylase biotin carboxyl carrier protein subunit, partial [Pseudorhodoplanes sp.]
DFSSGTGLVTVRGAAPDSTCLLIEAADSVYVLRGGRQTRVALADFETEDAAHAADDGRMRAPMHGKLLAVLVANGDVVAKGQRLAIIEAMKMEHALVAPRGGIVTEIAAEPGAQVAEGIFLLTISPAQD